MLHILDISISAKYEKYTAGKDMHMDYRLYQIKYGICSTVPGLMLQQEIDWMLFRMVQAMHMHVTARDLEDIVARYNHKPDASCSSW